MSQLDRRSSRTNVSIPWVLTTLSWTALIGATMFYFLQWYGTVGMLLIVIALVVTGLVTRFRYPIAVWAIVGLTTGHLVLMFLSLLAISRSD